MNKKDTNFSASLYPLREVSQMLDVSAQVVRRLCNSGLIPHIKRGRNGRRVLTIEQINLADIILKMRRAGFSPAEIRQYSRLYRQGGSTAQERLAMLTTHKRQLWQEIKQRQAAIDFIERQEEITASEAEE